MIWIIFAATAFAETPVKYLRNYDGDTITFSIGKVRVLGVDTPEIKSRKPCESGFGKVAQAFVQKELRAARQITLTNNTKRDIYDRMLADVHYDGKNLKEVLLREGLAVPYVPKKFQNVNWCKLQEKRNESKKL